MHPPRLAQGDVSLEIRKESSREDGCTLRAVRPPNTQLSGVGRGTESLSRQSRDDVTSPELELIEGNGGLKGHPGAMFVCLHSIYIKLLEMPTSSGRHKAFSDYNDVFLGKRLKVF
ncbi:hypothetical protein LDENG_00203480 [Lucifuga dentata]|nr:hypothetical protein LDENG_00203480 [Lucifuga dentata]